MSGDHWIAADRGMGTRLSAWIWGTGTFIAVAAAFAWFARIADALGGDGGVTNAIFIGLLFAAHVMDRIDPVRE